MIGTSDWKIIRSHILPHLVAPIIVYSTLVVATNILAEAGLSFLGLGIQQPTASWGNLLADRAGLLPDPAVADGLARASPCCSRRLRSTCSATVCATPSTRGRPASERRARGSYCRPSGRGGGCSLCLAGGRRGSRERRRQSPHGPDRVHRQGRRPLPRPHALAARGHTPVLRQPARGRDALRPLADRMDGAARSRREGLRPAFARTRHRRDRRLGDGTAVQDNCDSADEEPGWAGTSTCESDLELHTNGDISVTRTTRGLRLGLRGPKYKSPGHPCELDIRNDQLVAAVALDASALARLAAGRALSVPVGTRHTAPGHRLRPDPQLLALSAPLRRRRVPLRLRRHPDLERRSHHKAAVALLTVAAALSGCGGTGDARAQACAALDFRAATTAAGASRTLRAAIAADAAALRSLDADDPLAARFRGAKARAEQALASFDRDSLDSLSMSPGATILPTARRLVAEARTLRRLLCR